MKQFLKQTTEIISLLLNQPKDKKEIDRNNFKKTLLKDIGRSLDFNIQQLTDNNEILKMLIPNKNCCRITFFDKYKNNNQHDSPKLLSKELFSNNELKR